MINILLCRLLIYKYNVGLKLPLNWCQPLEICQNHNDLLLIELFY